MSDVNELLIVPLQKFSKDSMHLIKKCTKPDRKGELLYKQSFIFRAFSSRRGVPKLERRGLDRGVVAHV